MKELTQQLLRESRNELSSMHKSKMTLTERIKYERAMLRLQLLSDVLFKLQNQ